MSKKASIKMKEAPASKPCDKYQSFVLRGHRFKVGDDVMVRSGDTDIDYVAKVLAIFTDSEGDVFLDCQWYYRPGDTSIGKKAWQGTDELFESDHVDTCHVGCINSLSKVLSVDQYITRRVAQPEHLRAKPLFDEKGTENGKGKPMILPIYFSRNFYDHESRSLRRPVRSQPLKSLLNRAIKADRPAQQSPPPAQESTPQAQQSPSPVPSPVSASLSSPAPAPAPSRSPSPSPPTTTSSKRKQIKTLSSSMDKRRRDIIEGPSEIVQSGREMDTSSLYIATLVDKGDLSESTASSRVVGIYTFLKDALHNAGVAFRNSGQVKRMLDDDNLKNDIKIIDRRNTVKESELEYGVVVVSTKLDSPEARVAVFITKLSPNIPVKGKPLELS